jgi:hypothetical protein
MKKFSYLVKYKLFLLRYIFLILIKSNVKSIISLKNGFKKASEFKIWDGWSLSHESIILIAWLIVKNKINLIVEFGSGYSSIVLSEFVKSLPFKVNLITYEHNKEFISRLKPHIDNSSFQLKECKLRILSDIHFEELFKIKDPGKFFLEKSNYVDDKDYYNLKLKNIFYEDEFSIYKDKSIGLVILDGPNGNGRSIAFPLLKMKLKTNAYILLDDYEDYNFEDYLNLTMRNKKVVKISKDKFLEKEYIVWQI